MTHKRTIVFLITTFLVLCTATKITPREGKFLMDLFNVVRLNPASRLLIGVLIIMPLSVFAPWGVSSIFDFDDKDERAYVGDSSYTSRSFSPLDSTYPTCPARGASIGDYMRMLRITHRQCPELLICEISKNPKKFMPLSKVLLKKLPVDDISSVKSNTTEYKLIEAAKVGFDGIQDCQYRYLECPLGATSMINMDLLASWQFMSRFFKLKFVAETDSYLEKY